MGANNKYESHFLMQLDDVKEYAVDVMKFFEDASNVEVREISDGNINYVFQVYDTVSGRSLVIKQADKFLRSSGRPLDVYRNKIEAEILKLQGLLAKQFVPEVYVYDEAMCLLAMEDISKYKNLRKELLNGVQFKHLSENITTFMASTLLPTTDLVMDRAQKKLNVKLYTNVELCDISEDLVLTEPYIDYKSRNIVLDENLEFVEKHLYQNTDLHAHVAYLRNNFMNNAQALLHGDLHSGSIFANQEGIKVIDPEFAFYGPMGYDIGNVIGNLILTRANHLYCKSEDVSFMNWINTTIKDIFDGMVSKLSVVYDKEVMLPLYQNVQFKQQYLDAIMQDALGYAGTEVIRRVVGDTKVDEVTSVTDTKVRVEMERHLIKVGTQLITERKNINSGEQLVLMFKNIS